MKTYLHYNYNNDFEFVSEAEVKYVMSRSTMKMILISDMSEAQRIQMLLSSMSQVYYDIVKLNIELPVVDFNNTNVISFATTLVLTAIDNDMHSTSLSNVLHLIQYMDSNVSNVLIAKHNKNDISIMYTRSDGNKVLYGDMNDNYLINAFSKAYTEQFNDEDNCILDSIKSTNSYIYAKIIAISVLFESKQHLMCDKAYYLYCEILRRGDEYRESI